MEFMNRSQRPAQPAAPAESATTAAHTRRSRAKDSSLLRFASFALFISVTILALALVWFVVLGKPNSEASRVDNSKLQAVFLNGGQVYFGNITNLNDQFIRVKNIYYLRVNQQVQPDGQAQSTDASDVSLVKLGCELHGPEDEMLINREQVIFWENLKTDGQVAKAVKEHEDKNPNGLNCEEQAQQQTPTGNNEEE